MTSASRIALAAFSDQKVLVLGDAILDTYLRGTTGRLCPEAPVPVVNLSARQDVPGGAANTAANVRSLGNHAALLSVVGNDMEGKLLRQSLDDRGVRLEHLVMQPDRRTLAKHRVIAGSQILVRFDQGSTAPIDGLIQEQLMRSLTLAHAECDAVIISDYNYGVLTRAVIEHISALQHERPIPLVIDSKRLPLYRALEPTAIKPNYREALALLGKAPSQDLADRAESLGEAGPQILERTGARIACVTLDADGALVFERGKPAFRTYATCRRPAHASGAGDTFVAAIALALASGADATTAAEIASAAASIAAGKSDTSYCTRQELDDQIHGAGKVHDAAQLAGRLEASRRDGRRIVLTCGCFDILHRGHISYLSQAKAVGDVLVVAVNSDASIRRLKGPTRPINSQDDRVAVLSALSCIDYLVLFNEETPARVIEAVRPHLYVKGGDYTIDSLPEKALVERLGGQVQVLPFIAEQSTTRIIDRLRKSTRQAGPVACLLKTGGRHESRSMATEP
jgi:D-beta-D-heptose 7-phosphate kinase / D-beta-D-heptose 1-phosphate adenosyltransferase